MKDIGNIVKDSGHLHTHNTFMCLSRWPSRLKSGSAATRFRQWSARCCQIEVFFFITLYRLDTTINVSCKSYNLLIVSYMFRLLTAIIRLMQKDDANYGT